MNPYAPPMVEGPPPPQYPPPGLAPPNPHEARSRLMFPAIMLIVMSSLLILVFLLDLVLASTGALDTGGLGGSSLRTTDMLGPGFLIGVCIFAVLMNAVVLFSAIQMIRLRMWGFAFAGCIIGALPFVSSACCIITLPFSIWAIVVLFKPEVKASFH